MTIRVNKSSNDHREVIIDYLRSEFTDSLNISKIRKYQEVFHTDCVDVDDIIITEEDH